MGDQKQQENMILRDWFSFTSKVHTPEQLIEALGLSHCPWTQRKKGAHGYQDGKIFGSITIHYNGREDMGVWVEMTGQGCRTFEDLTTLPHKWDDLIAFVISNGLHLTRYDVAYDDHTGVLDIDRVQNDVEEQLFVSPFRFWETVRSSQGKSIYLGSPQSNVRVRIYDKARERGYTDDRHWVRVELQLRDDRAMEFLRLTHNVTEDGTIQDFMPVGQAFAGVLLNYMRFVEPNDQDSNKSRWSMAEYWAELLGDVSAISIYTSKGGAYNVARCKHYVIDMAGNAIAAMMEVCGSLEEFEAMIDARPCKPNPKYDVMIQEHHAYLEALAQRTAYFKDLGEENQYWIAEMEGKRYDNL